MGIVVGYLRGREQLLFSLVPSCCYLFHHTICLISIRIGLVGGGLGVGDGHNGGLTTKDTLISP